MTDLAVAALVRKRAELAGEIEHAQDRIAELRATLVHLDATIRLLCPDAEPELVKPKKPGRKDCDWFGRGELGRLALDVLRDAAEPWGSLRLARAVMERKGMEPGDLAALRRVKNMLNGALQRREGRLVERVVHGPRSVGWRVAAA
jgi:hypothetical protein